MKILKKLLIIIVALIVLVLVVALFTKKDYALERQTTINKPKQEVFSYVRLLKNSIHYNKWSMADPKAKTEFKGTDGTQGFIYAWDSEAGSGKGEEEITGIESGDSTSQARVDYEIRFEKPFEGKAESNITMVPVNANQTLVKWGFASEMAYPMNIMLLFFNMEDVMGKDLDESLSNLKNIVEKK